jgi:hypothetical protein
MSFIFLTQIEVYDYELVFLPEEGTLFQKFDF